MKGLRPWAYDFIAAFLFLVAAVILICTNDGDGNMNFGTGAWTAIGVMGAAIITSTVGIIKIMYDAKKEARTILQIKEQTDVILPNTKESYNSIADNRNNHIKTHELICEKNSDMQKFMIEKNNDMQKLVSDRVGEISTALKLQEQDRVNKYENLTEKQKDISDSLKVLSEIQREIESVNLANKELNSKVAILSAQIKELENKNTKLEMDLSSKIKELEDTKRTLDKEREDKPKGRQR